MNWIREKCGGEQDCPHEHWALIGNLVEVLCDPLPDRGGVLMSRKPIPVRTVAAIRVDVYSLLCDAIERGLERGWRLAHKHNDTPEPASIWQRQYDAILLEVCEYLSFHTNTDDGGK